MKWFAVEGSLQRHSRRLSKPIFKSEEVFSNRSHPNAVPTAYVLIKVTAGAESKIFDALLKVDGVKEVDVVYGEFDLIAKVSTRSMDELRNVVVKQIRGVVGVERTVTAIVASSSIKYPSEERLG